MASFFKEMSRNIPGFTVEDHVSLPDCIRTGHRPLQVIRVIAGSTVVRQPVLMTSTVKRISFLPPMALQPVVGPGILIRQASRPHSDTPPRQDSSGWVIRKGIVTVVYLSRLWGSNTETYRPYQQTSNGCHYWYRRRMNMLIHVTHLLQQHASPADPPSLERFQGMSFPITLIKIRK